MSRKYILFIILSFITVFINPTAHCENPNSPLGIVFQCDNSNVKRKDEFTLKAKLTSVKEYKLSSFSMKIKFDKSKFSYKNNSHITFDENSQIKSKCYNGVINLTFCNKDGLYTSNNNYTELFEIPLKVKNKADYGSTNIFAETENILDENGSAIEGTTKSDIAINILPPDTAKCFLKSLSPSVGKFNINFSPSQHEYKLDVPYDTKDIYFNFSTKSPNSTVKVSRHKLYAAGKETTIKITVSNPEEKAKLIYTIIVKRHQKPAKETKNSKNLKSNSKLTDAETINSEFHDPNSSTNFSANDYTEKFYCDEDIPDNYSYNEYENEESYEHDVIANDEYDDDDKEETSDETDDDLDENITSDNNIENKNRILNITKRNNNKTNSAHTHAKISATVLVITIFIYSTIELYTLSKNTYKCMKPLKTDYINMG